MRKCYEKRQSFKIVFFNKTRLEGFVFDIARYHREMRLSNGKQSK